MCPGPTQLNSESHDVDRTDCALKNPASTKWKDRFRELPNSFHPINPNQSTENQLVGCSQSGNPFGQRLTKAMIFQMFHQILSPTRLK